MFFKSKSEEKTPKILEEIIKKTREDVKKREAEFSTDWLGRSLAFNNYVPRDVKKVLKSTEENPYRIIAEIKKASPSKGVIREDFKTFVKSKLSISFGFSLNSALC